MNKILLNIGSGPKSTTLPDHYLDWEVIRLDNNPDYQPDICMDARKVRELLPSYDAIYCSHVLEHFYEYEISTILSSFFCILTHDGFAEIRVPDVEKAAEHMVVANKRITDIVYISNAGPIRYLDMFYGYAPFLEHSPGMEHHTGFSMQSLCQKLTQARFSHLFSVNKNNPGHPEAHVVAFKQPPTQEQIDMLKIPDNE